MMDISIAVIVIMTAVVAGGVLMRRTRRSAPTPRVERGASGLTWLYAGLALTLIVLTLSLVWTVLDIAEINSPPVKPALTLAVIGHQWWWEVRYLSDDPTQTFDTANEIHIPVGRPVLVRLTSADVIHSFWAPALTGKTDTIPGRTNLTWLQADKPGVYFGQCTEYCGVQHAHMALYVVAQEPAAFEAWRSAQLQPAATSSANRGEGVFQAHCSACHTVRGTEAGGIAGPDLTHLMSRQTIASGLLPNNIAALSGWISNPQALKPGAKMPAANLSGADLGAVTAYLQTLK
jgi:cytochrome c oxidase subunit 2